MSITHQPDSYECPFCRLMANEQERFEEVLLQSKHSVCFLGLRGNIRSGPTLLVATKEHYENLYTLPSEVIADAFELTREAALLLKNTFDVDGTTLWQHNEPAGNQEVWHFHIHVKGRLKGDTLYSKTSYPLEENERRSIISELKNTINQSRKNGNHNV